MGAREVEGERESRGGGGGLPNKSDEDARRLAQGCSGNLQILVLLWVFATKSYYICPSMDPVGLCIKKCEKMP